MQLLVFQLHAPLCAWGGAAVGEYRGSDDAPSESAIQGLLCAALGVSRDDETGLAAVTHGYGIAIGVQSAGDLLRDFHTAQVAKRAALKGRSISSRRQELDVDTDDLSTLLSTRDYRQDAAYVVVLRALEGAPSTLDDLATSLRRPKWSLYLGRKSCPPGAPLHPVVIDAENVLAAVRHYLERLRALAEKAGVPTLCIPPSRLQWSDAMDDAMGLGSDLSTVRKDRVIRRRGWQFGDRREHAAVMPAERKEA